MTDSMNDSTPGGKRTDGPWVLPTSPSDSQVLDVEAVSNPAASTS